MAHNRLIQRLSRLNLNGNATQSLPRAAHRSISTTRALREETHEPFTAAPPIADLPPQITPKETQDFYKLRIVPASPSYFTAQPRFMDDYLLAASLLAKNAPLPRQLPSLVPRAIYQSHTAYRSALQEPIKPISYTRLLGILRRLSFIHPSVMPEEVSTLLSRFRRLVDPNANKAKPIFIDEAGRARAVGRRKESVAVVYLVEGEGEVRINGKNLVQVFHRQALRDSAVWPLTSTGRIDKYNVWAYVKGGGTTGQAEAVTLGIARALLVHEPGLKPALRRAGVVTRDPRMVERKKPGRVKARKMPTWVKR